jgi:pyruvate,water dikinase
MRGYALLREMVVDAGRRLGLPAGDVCLLTLAELERALTGKFEITNLRLEIENRRVRRGAEGRVALADVIGEGEIETLGEVKVPAHGDRLEGFSISTGVATGKVKIVASPESAGDLGSGYVLVCRSTDPSWTPLFVNAAGIVLECGGSLSHGAVVAREMGKPAVVLPNATQILAENQEVAVDGVNGVVVMNASREGAGKVEEKVSPGDVRVAFHRLPPAPGRREKAAARLRNWAGLFWVLFLAVTFLAPALGLRELSIRALDVVLWPIYRAIGGLGTVAVIAAGLAFVSMVGQWLLTDTPRLRAAKRRAADLKREAAGLPEGSPRRKRLLALAAPVQGRLTMAAFVPLALLLGPMVMSFLWLPERIDPASANPRPGATAVVTAVVDPEYSGEVTIDPYTMKQPKETQVARSVRPTLAALVGKLEKGAVPPVVQAQAGQTGKSVEELLGDLRKFLERPLPAQLLTWSVQTEHWNHAVYRVPVVAAGGNTMEVPLVMGNAAPPPLNVEVDEKGNRVWTILPKEKGPIQAVKVRYTDSRRAESGAFFAPFAKLGWGTDFGWLGVYLVVYIVALFAARFVLRIP